MSDSIETTVAAHLDAWNAPAGSERDRAVASIYTDDVFVGEPQAALTGHAGVAQAIDGLQTGVPGAALTRTGSIQVVQDLATYTWALGPVGGTAVAAGRDVLVLRGGKISSLYVIIDGPDA
ncbi:nuclear transport factor 2 family protein [Mycobacteroides sp. LB1]|uniref:nuclear transport factor 2 family protein n=1 Tax=Mycobacteroides sp. LB1 TaxID=2750814 RepID=UPI0015DDC758|nr:nuclear transport factor 2 family protein [Mycobacteroides sp. LB1]